MSKEQRTSIDNGIWMCATHGRLIDTDELRFTIPMLKKWREFAEFRAKYLQEFGANRVLPRNKLIEIGFADETLTISSLGRETEAIGYALLDSCVHLVWGSSMCNAVRDVLVEIVRNTFVHGTASWCEFSIGKHSIRVTDNGADFNWLGLPVQTNGRGGAASVRHLFADFGDKLLLGSKRVSDRNITTIALASSVEDLELVAPCSTYVTDEELKHIRRGELLASWFTSESIHCKIVYVILPPFLPHSDAMLISDNIRLEDLRGRQLVFVVPHASDRVHAYLLERFPNSRMLSVDE